MCQFFSFVTEPDQHGGERYYFDWRYRSHHLSDDNHDSHSSICKYAGLDEDRCNKFEYNPLLKQFVVDQINSPVDDRIQAQAWVEQVDWSRIIEPLIVKPIISPLDLPEVAEVTPDQIELLHQWDSVRDSVRASVGPSVRASVGDSVLDSVRASVLDSVGDSVRDSVWASVWDSVGASVWASVRDSVGVYVSSFFAIPYKQDFSPCVGLWEMGLVPSFDGKTWRLHTGTQARIVYTWIPGEGEEAQ